MDTDVNNEKYISMKRYTKNGFWYSNLHSDMSITHPIPTPAQYPYFFILFFGLKKLWAVWTHVELCERKPYDLNWVSPSCCSRLIRWDMSDITSYNWCAVSWHSHNVPYFALVFLLSLHFNCKTEGQDLWKELFCIYCEFLHPCHPPLPPTPQALNGHCFLTFTYVRNKLKMYEISNGYHYRDRF